MFQNNKTGFGQPASNTSFGGGFTSGTGNTPFGQSAFGKPPSTTFPTPAFGSGGSTLFGSTTPATGGLFGTPSATPVFGQTQTPQQPAFGGFQSNTAGGGLFGAQQNTTSNLFGSSSNATSAFGAAKPAFGGFGTSQASTGLFGQQTQPQASTSLFGQAPAQSSASLFGSSGFGNANTANQATGTVIKFNPVNGTDTMVKNGATQTISTRHHCITCMKEYEHKSLEELRYEDYLANRKGPQQGGQPGGGLFGATAQPSLFGTAGTSASTSTGMFGANTAMGGFGAQSTGVFGQTNQQGGGLFGKPTGFGTATTSAPSTFSFNTPATTNPFQTANKPFGVAAPQTNSLFGAATSQPSTGFGTQSTGFGSTFGAQPNQGMGLFGQNKPAFNSLATTNAPFSFGTPAQATNTSSLFGAKPATAAPTFGGGGFGSTGTTGFGNTGSLFGQTQPAATGNTSLFGQPFKQSTPFSFGQPTSTTNTGLGTNLGLGGQSLFGSTAAKPAGSLFGTNTGSMFNTGNTFGGTSTFSNSSFNMGGLGTNQTLGGGMGGLGQGGQNLANPSHQQILALAAVPFGDSPLFKDLLPATGRADDLLKPTNPAAQKAVLSSTQFKVSPRNDQRLRTKPVPAPLLTKKSLFEGIEQSDDAELITFSPRHNARRLMLKSMRSDGDKTRADGDETTANDTVTSVSSPGPASPSADQPVLPRKSIVSPDNSALDDSWLHVAPGMREREGDLARRMFMSSRNNSLTSPRREWAKEDVGPSLSKDRPLQTSPKEKPQEEASTSLADLSGASEKDGSVHTTDPDLELVELDGPTHPAGIRLNRAGYYTIPSLSELADITAEDGTCVPENFTVGREGYGNVFFAESFDISGLDLDAIVHFRNREVTIYPDDATKPDVGQGLNRRAQVTLDKIWPVDKTSRQPITDVDRLKQMDYESKLKQACAKMKARFLDYRPQTGSWVFRVEHFSKYGLDDSDEEEPVPSDVKKLKLKPKSVPLPTTIAKPSELPPLQRNGDSVLPVDDVLDSPSAMLRLRDGPTLDRGVTSMDVHYDDEYSGAGLAFYEAEGQRSMEKETRPVSKMVASHKVQLMKASFFGGEEDIESVDSDIEQSDHKRSMQEEANYFQDSDMQKGYMDYRSPFPGQKVDSQTAALRISSKPEPLLRSLAASAETPPLPPLVVTPVVEVLKYKPDERPPTSLGLLWQAKLAAMRRPFDIALIKGGYKAAWGPRSTLLTLVTKQAAESIPLSGDFSDLGNFVCGRSSDDRSISFVQRLQLIGGYASQADLFKESVVEHLEAQLQHSLVGTEQECPVVRSASGVRGLHAHCDVAQQLADNCLNCDHLEAALEAWKLACALWGDLEDLQGVDTLNSHQENMARKAAVSSWLQDSVSPTVEKELADPQISPLQRIFSLLTSYEVAAAALKAKENKEIHLALHIAQLCLNPAFQERVRQQLMSWQDTEADKLIEPDRLKIYLLAAGLPLVDSSNGIINVCEGLDWKRAFAVHLWYLTSPVATVTDALYKYEGASGADQSDVIDAYAAAPEPAHSDARGSVRDLCYHLLKLYSNKTHPLERLLNPATHSSDPFEYRLSWFLQQTLTALGYSHSSDFSSSMVTVNFAAQLECHGLWQWAVFVLLHLAHVNRRRACVLDVIGRNVRLSEDVRYLEQEAFLVDRLGVPRRWISGAKAVLAMSLSRHHLAAEYLIEAGEWNQSHTIIMEHIAADAINNERYSELSDLLVALSPPERCVAVAGWSCGGGLLADFLTVMREVNALLADRALADNYRMERLLPQLTSLCTRINKMPCPTPKHTMCQAHIAKVTSSLVQMCGTLQRGDSWLHLASLVSKLLSLEDGAQEELSACIRAYPFP